MSRGSLAAIDSHEKTPGPRDLKSNHQSPAADEFELQAVSPRMQPIQSRNKNQPLFEVLDPADWTGLDCASMQSSWS